MYAHVQFIELIGNLISIKMRIKIHQIYQFDVDLIRPAAIDS